MSTCFWWLDAYATFYWRFDVMRIYLSLESFNWILLLPLCSRLSLPLMIDSWKTTQNKRDHVVLSLKWCGGRRSFASQGAFLFLFHMSWCLLSSTIVLVLMVWLLVLSLLELERGHDRSSLSYKSADSEQAGWLQQFPVFHLVTSFVFDCCGFNSVVALKVSVKFFEEILKTRGQQAA